MHGNTLDEKNLRLRSIACVAVLSLAVYGCAKEGGRSTVVTTDSAGVQIIESHAPSWPDGFSWRLGDEPVLDIGMLEGDPAYEFFRIAGAQRLSDGRIVVAEAGAFEIRYYDSEGNHLHSTGREGGGPGEFAGIRSIEATAEDTVLVLDWRSRRISYFDPSGAFARSANLTLLGQMGDFPHYMATFDDGTVLLGVRMFMGAEGIQTGPSRGDIVYLRSDPEGALLDTIAVRPGWEMHVVLQDNRSVSGGRPFGRYPVSAVYGNGFFHGSGDRYEIEYIDVEGRLLRSYRRPIPNTEVTTADIEAYKRERLESANNERQRQSNQTLLDAVTFPDALPAYYSFVADADGNLWVAVYRRPGDDQPRWTVFDKDGGMLGEVQTPRRFRIYQIGSDFVLGGWADDMDVQHIRMFELIKE